MSIDVWLLPTHAGEPSWSAINRAHGPGADQWLDDDDPAARQTIHPDPPPGWRIAFEGGLHAIADFTRTDHGTGITLWTPRWRWTAHLYPDSVALSYRRTGPANDCDLDDGEVINVAAGLGMIIWWEPTEWVDLRTDDAPDMFG